MLPNRQALASNSSMKVELKAVHSLALGLIVQLGNITKTKTEQCRQPVMPRSLCHIRCYERVKCIALSRCVCVYVSVPFDELFAGPSRNK